jgi:hypothetical protein
LFLGFLWNPKVLTKMINFLSYFSDFFVAKVFKFDTKIGSIVDRFLDAFVQLSFVFLSRHCLPLAKKKNSVMNAVLFTKFFVVLFLIILEQSF